MNDIENNLVKIKNASWEEVLSSWRQSEAEIPRWIEHYKKRGFDSWDDWRKDSVRVLKPETLTWETYQILNPELTIPFFYGGPFRVWIENFYNGREEMIFRDIALNPNLEKSILVKEIIENFPHETALIGLRTKYGIVIIEGIKRCCAVALAVKKGQSIHTSITIALANYKGKIPLMGKVTSPTA